MHYPLSHTCAYPLEPIVSRDGVLLGLAPAYGASELAYKVAWLGRSRLEPPQRPREHVRAAAPAVLSRDELVADPDRRVLLPVLDYSGSLNESLRPV
jgi:hypothetical protein